MRHAVRIVPFVVALGCRGGNELALEADLAKVTPASVSSDTAWTLFDRDVTSGFVPSNDPIELTFDRDQAIVAVRVFGASPYHLQATDKLGTPVGLPPVATQAWRAWTPTTWPIQWFTGYFEATQPCSGRGT